jgi:hypothetical protein
LDELLILSFWTQNEFLTFQRLKLYLILPHEIELGDFLIRQQGKKAIAIKHFWFNPSNRIQRTRDKLFHPQDQFQESSQSGIRGKC